ncbi:MAG TPA: hypothetical protein VJN92_22940 [Candidatus Acidoferrum sp.]|nr:hypothetical protein [Candidatus Acidoferrum sp.]
MNYKGHTTSGTAKRVPGTDTWLPQTVVDGRVYAFAPLNFPRKTFASEQRAVDYAVAYGIWIIDHDIPMQPKTNANSPLSASNHLPQSTGLLLYVASGRNNAHVRIARVAENALPAVSGFGNAKYSGYPQKELYLSPNRELVAVTIAPPGNDVWPLTYIAAINRRKLTKAQVGTFISWAPDSSKALLFYSPTNGPGIRKMYALDAQGNYYDLGLPNGTISADISPLDGSILYSSASEGTDNSTLYLRDSHGKDMQLLKGENSIFAWARWSPRGDKIVFLKSDLLITHSEVWSINADGTGAEKASDVNWGYPAVWSPDGTRFAFANARDIWEYDTVAKSLYNATNLDQGRGEHPSYSTDGKTLAFSAIGQIWKVENGSATQVTSDIQAKDYPILP